MLFLERSAEAKEVFGGVGTGMELARDGCVKSGGTTVDHWHLEVGKFVCAE